MQGLDIVIEDPRWTGAALAALAPAAVSATLEHLGIDANNAEITLLACDDARIAALNGDFRDKPQPTNVLSWPAADRAAPDAGGTPALPRADPDGSLPLGDVAISYDTCAAEATASGTPLHDHVSHLVVHGVLHLLGYDHIRDPDATLMEGLETTILCKLGIDDPY